MSQNRKLFKDLETYVWIHKDIKIKGLRNDASVTKNI